METAENKNRNPAPNEQGVRSPVLIGSGLVLLACLVAGVVFWSKRGGTKPAPEVSSVETVTNGSSLRRTDRAPAASNPEPPAANPAAPAAELARTAPASNPPPAVSATGSPPASRPGATAYTRQLVNNLANLQQVGLPKTPEQVAAWKQTMQQLVQQGAVSVPAIQEFLDKNIDFSFGTDGKQALGYGSARSVLLDALAQIGGPEATAALVGTLQTTTDPREVASLARTLEQAAPDQYRQQILDAARQLLKQPAQPAASPVDVAPLFDVLSKYGGAGAVTDLDTASSRWRYYSAIALAQLPDGAGVPSLIQSVQGSDTGTVKNIAALQMLTQAAAQNTDARNALVQAVRNNNIPPNLWAYLMPAFAGEQMQYMDSASAAGAPAPNSSDIRTFHIASGNQNFYTAPPVGGFTADQINQQLSLIDQLLAVAPNPSAQQTLQASRDLLLKRGGQPATGGK